MSTFNIRLLSLNFGKSAGISTLLMITFLMLFLSRRGILELNPLYFKGGQFSLPSFVQIEGGVIFGSWLMILVYLAFFLFLEGLILNGVTLKLPFGVGILSICFSTLFLILSVNATFYGIFALDPDFIISTSEPWLDIELCLKFVARIAFGLTVVLLLLEAVVVFLIYRRRGK